MQGTCGSHVVGFACWLGAGVRGVNGLFTVSSLVRGGVNEGHWGLNWYTSGSKVVQRDVSQITHITAHHVRVHVRTRCELDVGNVM